MGVFPLQFKDGENAKTLGFDGSETFDIIGLQDGASKTATVTATKADGSKKSFEAHVMLLTPKEVDYFRHGGLLQYVLRQLRPEEHTTELQSLMRNQHAGLRLQKQKQQKLWIQ